MSLSNKEQNLLVSLSCVSLHAPQTLWLWSAPNLFPLKPNATLMSETNKPNKNQQLVENHSVSFLLALSHKQHLSFHMWSRLGWIQTMRLVLSNDGLLGLGLETHKLHCPLTERSSPWIFLIHSPYFFLCSHYY